MNDIITGFYFFDIIVNFNSSYFEDNKVQDDYINIAKNYMKFWLWIDILATIPFHKLITNSS